MKPVVPVLCSIDWDSVGALVLAVLGSNLGSNRPLRPETCRAERTRAAVHRLAVEPLAGDGDLDRFGPLAAPIAGFMYYSMSTEAPEGFAGPNDHWHRHSNVCVKFDGPNGRKVPIFDTVERAVPDLHRVRAARDLDDRRGLRLGALGRRESSL